MPGASTILIAREDFSIPDGETGGPRESKRPGEIEKQFFELIREKRPDVIILDFRKPSGNGTVAIRKIRQQTDVPTVVIRSQDDLREQDYRFAGAAECLVTPVDVILLNSVIQKIKSVHGSQMSHTLLQSDTFKVAGMIFQPRQNSLRANGTSIQLTTAENHLLLHFVSRPWTVCRRAEIAEVLYDRNRPASDRAVDVVVTRLRKKITLLRGLLADNLIKTEFRSGYMFVSDVSRAQLIDGSGQEA